MVLTFKTDGYQGAINKSAVVYSNDTSRPPVTLTLKADVQVLVSIEPRGVLLEGYWGNDIQAEAIIKANEVSPLTLEPLELTVPNKVTYEIETIEEKKIYRVIFRNICQQPEKYQGILKLRINYKEKPEIEIGIFGYIRGDIEYQPERVFFGEQKDRRSRKRIRRGQNLCSRTVSVIFYKGKDLRIERVEINQELFNARIDEREPGKYYRIILSLNPEKLSQGPVNEKMIIYTNFKDDPVKVIPIQMQEGFRCRP